MSPGYLPSQVWKNDNEYCQKILACLRLIVFLNLRVDLGI